MNDVQKLAQEGAQLRAEIDQKTTRLRDINKTLAENAEFKNGGKTGQIITQHVKVKVQLKETVKWDQDKLSQFKSAVGDSSFFQIFKPEYKPISKKVLDANLELGEFADGIKWAMTVTEASPSVTYELLEA